MAEFPFLFRRIGEIFDIIVDYPDSKGALQDLKVSSSLVTFGWHTDWLFFRNVYKEWINDRSLSWRCERRKNQRRSFIPLLTARPLAIRGGYCTLERTPRTFLLNMFRSCGVYGSSILLEFSCIRSPTPFANT